MPSADRPPTTTAAASAAKVTSPANPTSAAELATEQDLTRTGAWDIIEFSGKTIALLAILLPVIGFAARFVSFSLGRLPNAFEMASESSLTTLIYTGLVALLLAIIGSTMCMRYVVATRVGRHHRRLIMLRRERDGYSATIESLETHPQTQSDPNARSELAASRLLITFKDRAIKTIENELIIWSPWVDRENLYPEHPRAAVGVLILLAAVCIFLPWPAMLYVVVTPLVVAFLLVYTAHHPRWSIWRTWPAIVGIATVAIVAFGALPSSPVVADIRFAPGASSPPPGRYAVVNQSADSMYLQPCDDAMHPLVVVSRSLAQVMFPHDVDTAPFPSPLDLLKGVRPPFGYQRSC